MLVGAVELEAQAPDQVEPEGAVTAGILRQLRQRTLGAVAEEHALEMWPLLVMVAQVL
jgi:hypothetical protein